MIKFDNKTISSVFDGEKGIDKIFKGTLVIYESFKNLLISGVPPLTLLNCKGVDLKDYKLYGNTVRTGTPTLETPAEIESVGEKTNNLININNVNNSNCVANDNELNVTIYSGNSSQTTGATLKELCPDIEVGKTYVLYFDTTATNVNFSVGSYAAANFWASGDKRTITEEDLTTVVRIGGGTTTTGRTITLSNIQLIEYGSNNIFDKDNMDSRNWYLNNGVPSSAGTFRSFILPCKPLTKYTGERLIDVSCPFGIAFFDEYPDVGSTPTTYKRLASDTVSATSTENSKYLVCEYFYTGTTSGFTEEDVVNNTLMLEEVEFEPYGYRIPVITKGKNLIDINGKRLSFDSYKQHVLTNEELEENDVFIGITQNGYVGYAHSMIYEVNGSVVDFSIYGGGYGIGYKIKNITQTGTYCVNCDDDFTQRCAVVKILDGEITLVKTINGAKGTFEVDDINSYYVFVIRPDKGTYTFKNMQIEFEEVTNYEPYIEPITTNIYLNTPLRKLGNYADYIDFTNQKIIRNVAYQLLDGDESYSNRTDDIGLVNCKWFQYGLPYIILNTTGLSNRFSKITSSSSDDTHLRFVTGTKYLGVIIQHPDIVDTASFKAWLVNNNVDVYYIMKTPIEETIELPNIPTIKGTTILEVDTNIQLSNMEVTYKGKGE